MSFFSPRKSLVDQRKDPDQSGPARDFNFTHDVDLDTTNTEEPTQKPLDTGADEDANREVDAAAAEADADLRIIKPTDEDMTADVDPRFAPAPEATPEATHDSAAPEHINADSAIPTDEPSSTPNDDWTKTKAPRPPIFSLDEATPATNTASMVEKPTSELLNIENLHTKVEEAIAKIKTAAEKQKTEIDANSQTKIDAIQKAADKATEGLAEIDRLAA